MSGSKAWSGETLLDAAPSIARRMPDAQITLVGGGSKATKLRALAKQANRTIGSDFVCVEGFTSDPLAKMASAALVIGGGYTALEALYNGRPAIATGFGYQGPIMASDVPAGYDRHFGDREPSGGPFSRVTPDELVEAIVRVRGGLAEYTPRRDWFPLDHSLDGQAARLEALVETITRSARAA